MNAWGKVEEGKFKAIDFADRMHKVLDAGVYKVEVSDGFFGSDVYFTKLPIHDRGLIKIKNSQAQVISNSIQKFWDKKEAFRQLNVVFKRGILLTGKQGGGKTSILNIIYSKLVEDGGVVLVGSNPNSVKEGLDIFRAIEPDRHVIVVLEDIDNYARGNNDGHLVELLDGTVQYPNTVFLATTNYIDKISDRVKNRPSRFDEVIEVLPPNSEVREIYFRDLEADSNISISIKAFVRESEGFTFAQMKELFISSAVLEESLITTAQRLRSMDSSSSPPPSKPEGLAALVATNSFYDDDDDGF